MPALARRSASSALLVLALLAGCRPDGEAAEAPRPEPRIAWLARLAFFTRVEPGAQAFFLDSFETTWGQLRAWAQAGGPAPAAGEVPDDWPARGVTPAVAQAFARWRGLRLPLLEEWEWAVGLRGSEADIFPWGRGFDLARLDHLKANTAELGLGRPTAVGTFELGAVTGRKGLRVYDLVGNVAEWVRLPARGDPAEIEGRYLLDLGRRAATAFWPAADLPGLLAPLGPEEWQALERPWGWVGWHFASQLDWVIRPIPDRVSPPRGWHEAASVVGFRCAAWPAEIVGWLAAASGPEPSAPGNGPALEAFLARHRDVLAGAWREQAGTGDPVRREWLDSRLR